MNVGPLVKLSGSHCEEVRGSRNTQPEPGASPGCFVTQAYLHLLKRSEQYTKLCLKHQDRTQTIQMLVPEQL